MRGSLFAAAVFLASPVTACEQGFYGASLPSKIDERFDYLICLSNEQATVINNLSREVERLQQRVDALEARNRTAAPLPPIKRTPDEQREIDDTLKQIGATVRRLNPPPTTVPAQ